MTFPEQRLTNCASYTRRRVLEVLELLLLLLLQALCWPALWAPSSLLSSLACSLVSDRHRRHQHSNNRHNENNVWVMACLCCDGCQSSVVCWSDQKCSRAAINWIYVIDVEFVHINSGRCPIRNWSEFQWKNFNDPPPSLSPSSLHSLETK